MKEYLFKGIDGEYRVVNHDCAGRAIEIPEGAETYATDSMLGNKITKFFKEGFVFLDGMWIRCSFNHADGDILWKRHTKPEELPFVDDTQPHSHYFIDVSDTDSIDFYEIAHRYGISDPCVQHILKKCLAIGNRGHKDLHTDMKDIHDTAVRMLAMHGIV